MLWSNHGFVFCLQENVFNNNSAYTVEAPKNIQEKSDGVYIIMVDT